ncbi:hypothetical protein Droror1_Dr00018279 [Drosera rotundifolia]
MPQLTTRRHYHSVAIACRPNLPFIEPNKPSRPKTLPFTLSPSTATQGPKAHSNHTGGTHELRTEATSSGESSIGAHSTTSIPRDDDKGKIVVAAGSLIRLRGARVCFDSSSQLRGVELKSSRYIGAFADIWTRGLRRGSEPYARRHLGSKLDVDLGVKD